MMRAFITLAIAIYLLVSGPQAAANSCTDLFASNTKRYSPEVDALPTGSKKIFTEKTYFSEFDAAKVRLTEALDAEKWERIVEDGGMIINPEALKGETIAGVTRSEGENIVIFAGKVKDVFNVSSPKDRPNYHARILGPQGEQIITISNSFHTHSVHRLK